MFLFHRNAEKNRAAMHSVDAQPEGESVVQVARKFVALYYRVLNDYESYLFQFYGPDSTVVVSEVKENGQPETTKAEHMPTIQELLRQLYEGVTINVRNCTPQASSAGCISLLITGLMTRKTCSEARTFTQALILSRQDDGYFIKTDTVLVLPVIECLMANPSLLDPSFTSCQNEKHLESDDSAMRAPDKKMQLKLRAETSHGRVPSIDINHGMSSISGSSGHPQHNGHVCLTTISKDKERFSFDVRTRDVMTVHDQCLSAADINRKGCQTARDRNTMMPCYNSLPPNKDRCGSPLSAPGALPSPLPADGLNSDFRFHHQQWSLKSSPRNCVPDATQRAVNEVHRLFACKLPLGITADVVTDVFSKYGTLAEDEPVRVFTGQNNCYACVSYTTEQDMQNAIGAEIRIGETLVVTDAWRPRERRPKRRRSENAEHRLIGAAN